MIDLETMSTTPNAAIIAIGAVFFDPHKNCIGGKFYRIINLKDAAKYGEIDAKTVIWWMQQSDEARSIFQCWQRQLPLSTVLAQLNQFIYEHNREKINLWGNGSSFDCAILDHAYRQTGTQQPHWDYWNHRDVRTLVDIGRHIKHVDPKKTIKRGGTHHNALDDAVFQAKYVCEIYQALKQKDASQPP